MFLSILKKFYRPFLITYIFFSVAISFYPSFDFYSFKGQIIIITVSIFNGILGIFVTRTVYLKIGRNLPFYGFFEIIWYCSFGSKKASKHQNIENL